MNSAISDFSVVYVSAFPFECLLDFKIPKWRKLEIDEAKNPQLKSQRLYSWILLEKLLLDVFSDSKAKNTLKRENNRLCGNGFFVSISHTDNIIAVGVSNGLIGIDIQKNSPSRFSDKLAKRILNSTELSVYDSLSIEDRKLYLNECWTKKEALFKFSSLEEFHPSEVDTVNSLAKTFAIKSADFSYQLSVVTEKPESISVVCLNDFSVI